MSLARRHSLITPSEIPVVSNSTRTDVDNVSTRDINIGTPPEGNLLVLVVGGVQNRTVTFPGGWTQVTPVGGIGSMSFGYKIAGASESSPVTINFSGNLQGQVYFYSLSNTSDDVISGTGTASTFGAGITSASWANYDVPAKSIYIQTINFGQSETWTIDDNYTQHSAGSLRHFAAYKIYGNVIDNEDATWSGAATGAGGSVGAIAFFGREKIS